MIIGDASDIPDGSMKMFQIGKFGVGVYNVKGTFYGITNYCPHRGAPLCRGTVVGLAVGGAEPYEVSWEREGEILRCPWHGWEFDVVTGSSIAYPETGIRTYPVVVKDGKLVVEER